MRDKIASLIEQVRKCAAELEYLADEEEKGFTAGIEAEEEKIAKRLERIAHEFDSLDMSLVGEEEEETEEESTEVEEISEEEEEVSEETSKEDEEVSVADTFKTWLEEGKKQASKEKLIKVACTCTKCGNKEDDVAMTESELAFLKDEMSKNSGELFGPPCENCNGELLPDEL